MNKIRTIVFKVSEFSHISETFILKQVIFAIELGYDVKVLVDRLIPKNQWAQSEEIELYKVRDKIVVEDLKIPPNKFLRFIKWVYLFFISCNKIIPLMNYHKLKPKFSLSWLYEWCFYMKFEQISLFHIQYGTNKYPLDQLKAIGFKPKIICSFHGHDAFFPINDFINDEYYYQKSFKYFEAVVSNTNFLTQQLVKLGCPLNKIREIHAPVNSIFFKAPINKKDLGGILKLITIGRLELIKGHYYMFSIIRRLKKMGVSVELKVIGQGSQSKWLEKFISENDLQNEIRLLGEKTPKEISEILTECHVFLFTSIKDKNNRSETQGLAISEAMASGLPVIAFDSGGVKHTFQHNISGFLVKELDEKDFVQRIIFLHENRSRLIEMAKEARNFSRSNFGEEKIKKKWKNLYQNLF